VSELRLGSVLTRRFTRVAWTALAAYGLLVVALFALAGEMALRRSLEHSADLTQSLLGAYRDSTSGPAGVMPSALADQLVAMGGQVVITRTTTGAGGKQDVYFVSADNAGAAARGPAGQRVARRRAAGAAGGDRAARALALPRAAPRGGRVRHLCRGESRALPRGAGRADRRRRPVAAGGGFRRRPRCAPGGGGRAAAARACGRRDARHRSGGAGHATDQSHGPGGSHRFGRQRESHARAGGPRASCAAGVHRRRQSRAAHAADPSARAGAVGRRRGPQRDGDARGAGGDGARARSDGEARGRAAADRARREPPAGVGAGAF